MMNFVLYVKPGCPWCRRAEEFLDARGYEYQRIDVYKDAEAYAEMKRLSGQSYTPTLHAGELILKDFGPTELEAFLQKNKLRQ
jgi:glutaredoxin 3